ncbi:hypothetical protein VP01_2588g1 [Puccinia sorghi]|uniref:Spindle pole body component n=1 Tax=Puccinia sorghi TaxID=27349 RepID=A0A0L6V4S3_9BASI|nr:hypothetical protein VP01_2588g1 [Puccinia sorghi]
MSVQETLLSLSGHTKNHHHHHQVINQLSTLYSQINSKEAHPFLKQPIRAELANYQHQLIRIEHKLLTHHSELVPANSKATPLSAIIAELNPWSNILQALAQLIHLTSSHDQNLTQLIQRVHLHHSRSGYPHIQSLFSRIQVSLEQRWLNTFREFLIYGHQPLTPLELPILPALQPIHPLAQSLLHISHARDILKLLIQQLPHRSYTKNSTKIFLPPLLQELLRNALANIHSLSHPHFRIAIKNIQEILSNYLFSTYLTPEILSKTIRTMTDIFLMRGATFAGNLVAEMKQLKARHAARGRHGSVTSRELEVVFLKAGINTEEVGEVAVGGQQALDLEGFSLGLMQPGSLEETAFNRAILSATTTTNTNNNNHHQLVQLSYTPPPGLSFLFSPQVCRRYSAIHACLFAFLIAQQSCKDIWRDLAQKDRLRSRLSTVVHEEEEEWRQLARLAFEALRRMTWFINTMVDYFLQDVVDPSMHQLTQELNHQDDTEQEREESKGDSSGEFLTIHGSFLGRIEVGLGLSTDDGEGGDGEETRMSVRLGAILEVCEELLGAVEAEVVGLTAAARMLAEDESVSSCQERRQVLVSLLLRFDRNLRLLILHLRATSPSHSSHNTNKNNFNTSPKLSLRAGWDRLAAKLNFNAWFLPAQ